MFIWIIIILLSLFFIIGMISTGVSENKKKRRQAEARAAKTSTYTEKKPAEMSVTEYTPMEFESDTDLTFTAIDLETATSDRSSICEIGIAVVENSKITTIKSWYVRPMLNMYDSWNISIHGITPEMTENCPEFPEVWKEVLPYLSGRMVVAHNTSFDMYAIRDALDMNEMDYPDFEYICSYRSAKYALPGISSYSLESMCEHFGITNRDEHRAGTDAEACAKVLMRTVEAYGCTTIEEFIRKKRYKIGQFGPGYIFTPFSCSGHAPGQEQKAEKPKPKPKKEPVVMSTPSEGDPTNYFYSKTVCFTGKCSYGSRTDLEEMVVEVGGIPVSGVSKKTNVLVVGQQDYRQVGEDGMSTKQEKAMALQESGHHIEVMSEEEFLEKIKKQESQ